MTLNFATDSHQMAALSVFEQVGRIADVDFIAMEVLPIMWSFSLGPLLNLQQVSPKLVSLTLPG